MQPGWSSVLLLLPLISVGSRADLCTAQWESLEEGRKMVVKGSFSIRPPQPFIIDFDHFAQMGKFCHSRSIFISTMLAIITTAA